MKQAQRKICDDNGATFYAIDDNGKVGISKNVKDGLTLPIHGLRHPPVDDSTGWYIWAGEYSENQDFFQPLHAWHLQEWSPQIIKFLGLPPGWRFLVANEYEDVWYDETLLEV